jgi:hypothetical protein
MTNTTKVKETKPKAAPKEAKVTRKAIVDGVEVDFGVRANLLTETNVEVGTIVFKLITGHSITWNVPFANEISIADDKENLVKTAYFYGLAAKIKSSLATVEVTDLQASIEKQIAAINEGKFSTRSSASELVLTNEQKAFAIVKSRGDETKAHWIATADPTVIAEVSTAWLAFTKSERNAIRKNAYVKAEIAQLEIASGKVEAL